MEERVIIKKDGGKFVISTSALDYGLDRNGKKDCTAALQKAIDECQAAGGGTVYLPAGRYALHGELTVRTSVMLHGAGAAEDGTLLCCYFGRGAEDGMQIRMEACTGLLELALYYPEQDMENPVPYPPTVRQQGSDSITVEGVAFINPWIGIQCGPDGNELHFIKNVEMSPLCQGVFMDMTTDIGRMQGLVISPACYSRFIHREQPERGAALAKAAEESMLSRAVGIYMARSDWEYGYDITVEGCRIGLLVTSRQDIGPNAQISKLKIAGCETGLCLHCGNPYGIAITDGVISSGEKRRRAAIWCDDTFHSVLQCFQVRIEGEYEHLVGQEGDGQLSFVECTFAAKGRHEDVLCGAGGLSLLNTAFAPGGTHVRILKGAGGVQIVGSECEGGGELAVAAEKEAAKALLYEKERLPLPKRRSAGYQPCPYRAEPEASRLYSVTAFGAAGDGKADDTEGFRRALAAAGETGGYVYVPGGWYRITKPLRVPAGVELRGTAEVPCHTMGGGSVLLVCCGHGEEGGEPFLTLEGSCGIRGIVLYHPKQDPVSPVAYPWAVQSAGDRCYAVDVVFVNSWDGLDFGSRGGKGHYISYVSGAPIHCGIFAGGNDGDIWIENVQYNPHYWYRCSLPKRPSEDTWKEFWHNQIKYLDAFLYGANRSLHVLNTFVFAAKNGVRFIEQGGKGTNGVLIGHGTDGGECGIRIDMLEAAEFINTELVTIESPKRRIYLRNAGEGAVFYNTLMWGAPDTAVLVENGSLGMVQTNIVDSGEVAIVVEAGRADIAAAYFYRRERQLLVRGGKVSYLANMAARLRKGAACPDMGGGAFSPTDIQQEAGEVTKAFNWCK